MTEEINFKIKLEDNADLNDIKSRLEKLADLSWRVVNEKRHYLAGTTSHETYQLLEQKAQKEFKDKIKRIEIETQYEPD